MTHRHRPPPDRADRPEVAKSLPDLAADRGFVWSPDPQHVDPMHMELQDNRSAPQLKRRRRHVFRWVFLAVQAIFLTWVITGAASSSGTPKACTGMMGQALKSCQDAGHAGTALGVGLIVVVWAAVDVVLALCWLVFRRRP